MQGMDSKTGTNLEGGGGGRARLTGPSQGYALGWAVIAQQLTHTQDARFAAWAPQVKEDTAPPPCPPPPPPLTTHQHEMRLSLLGSPPLFFYFFFIFRYSPSPSPSCFTSCSFWRVSFPTSVLTKQICSLVPRHKSKFHLVPHPTHSLFPSHSHTHTHSLFPSLCRRCHSFSYPYSNQKNP